MDVVVAGLTLLIGSMIGGAVRSWDGRSVPGPREVPRNSLPGSPLPRPGKPHPARAAGRRRTAPRNALRGRLRRDPQARHPVRVDLRHRPVDGQRQRAFAAAGSDHQRTAADRADPRPGTDPCTDVDGRHRRRHHRHRQHRHRQFRRRLRRRQRLGRPPATCPSPLPRTVPDRPPSPYGRNHRPPTGRGSGRDRLCGGCAEARRCVRGAEAAGRALRWTSGPGPVMGFWGLLGAWTPRRHPLSQAAAGRRFRVPGGGSTSLGRFNVFGGGSVGGGSTSGSTSGGANASGAVRPAGRNSSRHGPGGVLRAAQRP